jgi:VWFA-related protein
MPWSRSAAVAGMLTLIAATQVASAAEPKTPTFPSRAELITVDAVVVDKDGKPVSGLTREDFVVKEDGKTQDIASFEAFVLDRPADAGAAAGAESAPTAPSRRGFALLVDDVSMNVRDAADLRRDLQAFIGRSLREGDQVTLATTSGSSWWTGTLPRGQAQLSAAVQKIRGLDFVSTSSIDPLSDYEAMWITHRAGATDPVFSRIVERWTRAGLCGGASCASLLSSRAVAVDAFRRQGTRATLYAVIRALEELAPLHGRKSVLLFSRGFVDDPASGMVRSVVAASRHANAAVYFLDVRGLVATPGIPSIAEEMQPPDPAHLGAMALQEAILESSGAQTLAAETGGITVRNTNDLARAAARIEGESRAFYLLGFYPPAGKRPGDWRKLRVSVKGKDLEVRARRGYTVMAPDAETKS